MRVTVFDIKGRFSPAIRRCVHGRWPSLAAGGMQHFIPPRVRGPQRSAPHVYVTRALPPLPPDPTRSNRCRSRYVEGGYVGFGPSFPLLLVSLDPVLAHRAHDRAAPRFCSRGSSAVCSPRQALRPINEVSDSLRALADGDYTQRRFVMAGRRRSRLADGSI